MESESNPNESSPREVHVVRTGDGSKSISDRTKSTTLTVIGAQIVGVMIVGAAIQLGFIVTAIAVIAVNISILYFAVDKLFCEIDEMIETDVRNAE